MLILIIADRHKADIPESFRNRSVFEYNLMMQFANIKLKLQTGKSTRIGEIKKYKATSAIRKVSEIS